jgi:hypothetical protein
VRTVRTTGKRVNTREACHRLARVQDLQAGKRVNQWHTTECNPPSGNKQNREPASQTRVALAALHRATMIPHGQQQIATQNAKRASYIAPEAIVPFQLNSCCPSVLRQNLQCQPVRKWTPERNAIGRTHARFKRAGMCEVYISVNSADKR